MTRLSANRFRRAFDRLIQSDCLLRLADIVSVTYNRQVIKATIGPNRPRIWHGRARSADMSFGRRATEVAVRIVAIIVAPEFPRLGIASGCRDRTRSLRREGYGSGTLSDHRARHRSHVRHRTERAGHDRKHYGTGGRFDNAATGRERHGERGGDAGR